MPRYESDGLSLAYIDEGKGEPILLIHGFASTATVNWVNTGWVDLLVKAGRRVIAVDVRGHGDSDKPHDPARYGADTMAADMPPLLDHLGIGETAVMGYSMGARISTFFSIAHPERVKALILAGMASRMMDGANAPEVVADAMEAASLDDVTTPRGRAFRQFADRNGADLKALAACIRGPKPRVTAEQLAKLTMPVLIAVGSEDDVAGSAEELAKYLPNPEVLTIVGRDHMRTVGDKVYKAGTLAFLERQ